MKIKELSKAAPKYHGAKLSENSGNIPAAAGIILSALAGYLAAGTNFGGGGAPLCTSLAAVLPTLGGTSAFIGTMSRIFLTGRPDTFITEIAAMPAAIIAKAFAELLTGRKISPRSQGIIAAAAYVVCGTAAAFFYKISAALIMAIVFRGIISGTAAFLAGKTFSAAADGTVFSAENRIPLSVVYVLGICMLCGISLGTLNIGRAAGAFVILAAVYRSGSAAGGAIAALTAFGAGTASRELLPSSPVLICSALASGMLRRSGRVVSAVSFLGSGLAGALIYGMTSDNLKLLADMSAAAVVFCALPDKFYRSRTDLLNGRVNSVSAEICGERLKFASAAVADVRESFLKAAGVLSEKKRAAGISETVCGKVCSLCRSSAFCGESDAYRIENYFRGTEKILERKGAVSERDLHRALDVCPHKTEIAEEFNFSFRKMQAERRSCDTAECMREITSEQLGITEKMLDELGSGLFPFCDEELSETADGIISSAGAISPSTALFSDKSGRVYIECFYEGMLNVRPDELTEKMSFAADRELAPPEVFTVGAKTRLCFHEQENFSAEIGSAKVNGREETSGDFGTVFRDGFGNLSIILSDGMGSGARAAVESCMTVSVAARLMKAGLGAESAIRFANLLLLAKSAEECFSTVDLLTVNMFSGKAEIIKLGAAQSFIKTNGSVKTVESRTTPVGIVTDVEIERREFRLSDGDEVVMMTDGIPEDQFPRVRELMLSVGVTSQECAERIIAAAENGKENDISRQDDKTVYAVKLHKI